MSSTAAATAARLRGVAMRERQATIAFEAAVRVMARAHRLPVEAVRAPRGGGRAAWSARRTALYLAVVGGDVPASAVARVAGVGKTTVQKALAILEERRDRADVEARLLRLEADLERRIS